MATRASSVEIPDYSTDSDEYKNAIPWNGSFSNNTNYKIEGSKTTTGKISVKGTNVKLFVSGKWSVGTLDVGGASGDKGVELIILDGGEVIAEKMSASTGETNVYIMPGGKMTITGKTATIGATNSVYVLGELNVPNGQLDAQNSTGSVLFISSSGVINAKEMLTHNVFTYIENNGVITVETWIGGGHATVYNSCLIQATKSLDLKGTDEVTQDRGILLAPSISHQGNDVKFILRNGSMIKCDELSGGTSLVTGENIGNRSLVKVQTIKNTVQASGFVTVETNTSNKVTTSNGADVAAYDKSSVVIAGCGGEGNEGDPGEDPNPDFPNIPVAGKYTYMFEDNWPLYGDYDMNDVVLYMNNMKILMNANNMAERFTFDVTLQAVGAQKRIAAALAFDLVNTSNIKSVSHSSHAPSAFDVSSVGVETGQTKAVIPLFDEVHTAFNAENPNSWFINTVKTSPDNADPVTKTITVEFVKPILVIDLNINKLNFFIVSDISSPGMLLTSDTRKEIHLAGFEPTAKANTSLFGNHNDGSSIEKGRYYLSKEDNLAWGIVVPENIKWMIESTNINKGYLDFENWAKSGGTTHKEWWKANETGSNIVNELLY